MLLVKREGESYGARSTGYVMIYSCTSLRDPELNGRLMKLMGSGKIFSAQSLRRDKHDADDSCLLHGADSCLSSKAI